MRRSPISTTPLILVACTLLLSACGGNLGPFACTEIFVYGLNMDVVDAATDAPRADSATMTLRDGSYEEVVTASWDGLTLSGAGERAGTYQVTIERPGYATWSTGGITVVADECHVIPVSFTARLQATP